MPPVGEKRIRPSVFNKKPLSDTRAAFGRDLPHTAQHLVSSYVEFTDALSDDGGPWGPDRATGALHEAFSPYGDGR